MGIILNVGSYVQVFVVFNGYVPLLRTGVCGLTTIKYFYALVKISIITQAFITRGPYVRRKSMNNS